LVIGGSVGGLFAALLLRNIGWEASVFERAHDDLGDRGAAIGLTDALIAVMRRIGMTIQHNPGPAPPWFQVVGILEAA